jgi:hypothetical protein
MCTRTDPQQLASMTKVVKASFIDSFFGRRSPYYKFTNSAHSITNYIHTTEMPESILISYAVAGSVPLIHTPPTYVHRLRFQRIPTEQFFDRQGAKGLR